MEALIELSGVTKMFRSEPPVRPLDGLDLRVGAGEVVAVTGVSGKGKSTLLNVMGGLLRPDEGSVLFKGEDVCRASAGRLDALHRQGVGFVFQSPYLFQALTARENLVFARKAARARADEERVDDMLERFGLADRADHLPCELSVGQKRRLVVVRTLLADHEVILADEPTNDLDEAWSDFVFGQFKDFAATGGRAVVVVTHDQGYARLADTVYELDGGVLHDADARA